MVCQGPDCGNTFEAKRKFAKYCSKKCSVRASRAGQLGEPTPASAARPGRPKRQPVASRSRLELFTRRELAKVKRLDTSAGQAALVLAQRIDAGGVETGSALAALVREHASAMDRATAQASQGDPVEAMQAEVAKRAENDLTRQRGKRERTRAG